jgi:hypothetical protein
MFEFLIKRTDGDWFNLQFSEFNHVLHPNSFPFKTVAGWGDHRIEVLEWQISFSYEDSGIQVCFEGEISEEMAIKITQEICHNVIQATGQSGEVLQIT